mgnify:CR=1 FL=1
MSTGTGADGSDWYGTRAGRALYWGLIVVTLLAVAVSTAGFPAFLDALLPVSLPEVETTIPPYVYLFGFLGATVYAFTTFARRFDEHGRYRLKVFSRTIAALPLVAGVYLLAFSFLGFGTEPTRTGGMTDAVARERVIAGLVFLAGLYVSTTLLALETVANRLLGVDEEAIERTREGYSSDGTDRGDNDSEESPSVDDPAIDDSTDENGGADPDDDSPGSTR